MQDKIQFVSHVTFYPLSKFSRCKEKKSPLSFATRKLVERVDSKTHKLNLCALQSTRSINFRAAKDRRDFYSLQRENLLSGQKVIRATNRIVALQRSLVRDKLQESVARITWS